MHARRSFDHLIGAREQGRRHGEAERLADRAYVLETGRITLSGAAAAVSVDGRVREAYLGV